MFEIWFHSVQNKLVRWYFIDSERYPPCAKSNKRFLKLGISEQNTVGLVLRRGGDPTSVHFRKSGCYPPMLIRTPRIVSNPKVDLSKLTLWGAGCQRICVGGMNIPSLFQIVEKTSKINENSTFSRFWWFSGPEFCAEDSADSRHLT